MTKLDAKEKFLTIKKANEILIGKIDELRNYIETQSFNMGEKEINKYYNLKNNEKAQKFKAEYEKKTLMLNDKLTFYVENLATKGASNFIKDLTNYYAKVEDEYFELLGFSKNETLNASGIFKCEVLLNYYKNNLVNINNLENAFIKQVESVSEQLL